MHPRTLQAPVSLLDLESESMAWIVESHRLASGILAVEINGAICRSLPHREDSRRKILTMNHLRRQDRRPLSVKPTVRDYLCRNRRFPTRLPTGCFRLIRNLRRHVVESGELRRRLLRPFPSICLLERTFRPPRQSRLQKLEGYEADGS